MIIQSAYILSYTLFYSLVLIPGGWGHDKSDNHVDSHCLHAHCRAELVIFRYKYLYQKLGVRTRARHDYIKLIVIDAIGMFNIQ